MWQDNLKKSIQEEIRELACEHGIEKVILFGSRARGDHKERSDIDLAISGGNTAAFAVDADERIRTLLLFDVVNLDGPVQPELLASIEKEGKILYEKV